MKKIEIFFSNFGKEGIIPPKPLLHKGLTCYTVIINTYKGRVNL